MQLFSSQNRHFGIDIFDMTSIPYREIGLDARQLCCDAYHLCQGNAALSAELLRIADSSPGTPIRHLIVLRTCANDKTVCKNLSDAFSRCAGELLSRAGYLFSPVKFHKYLSILSRQHQSVFALVKDEIFEGDGLSKYISLPVFGDDADLTPVYGALEGSGCSLSIQMTPQACSPAEVASINRFYASCSRAADGGITPLRDNLANFAKDRWHYYVERAHTPSALTNIIISGPSVNAALLATRFKSALQDRHSGSSCLRCIDLSSSPTPDPQQLPWQYENLLREKIVAKTGLLSRRLFADEVGTVMQLPSGTKAFTGLKHNPFSLLRRDIVSQTDTANSIPLGRSHCDTPLSLLLADFKMHVGVFGKSGFGKTTLLLNLINSLTRRGINTLVLDPVKREYRTLKRHNAKVFSVENPSASFYINPFLPPSGVTLQAYKPHLLRAFLAAFTMPDPLPSMFAAALSECYALYGWQGSSRSSDEDVTVFGLSEFIRVFQDLLQNSGYSGEVKNNIISGGTFRLRSILERCQLTFENVHSIPIDELLSGQTVLELGGLEGEEKCLVASLTMISSLAYLRTTRESNSPLENIIVLDEAHALLDVQSRTEEGTAASEAMRSLIENMQVEMRSLGVGLVIADQTPSRIGGRLIHNCDTQILFRLTGEESDFAAEALGLSTDEHQALKLLDIGHALLTNHTLNSVIGVQFTSRMPEPPVVDRELRRLIGNPTVPPPFLHCSLCAQCQNNGCQLPTREKAYMVSIQMYHDCRGKLIDHEALLRHLLDIPSTLQFSEKEDSVLLSKCTAIHFYRKAVSNNSALGLGRDQLSALLRHLEGGLP